MRGPLDENQWDRNITEQSDEVLINRGTDIDCLSFQHSCLRRIYNMMTHISPASKRLMIIEAVYAANVDR